MLQKFVVSVYYALCYGMVLCGGVGLGGGGTWEIEKEEKMGKG